MPCLTTAAAWLRHAEKTPLPDGRGVFVGQLSSSICEAIAAVDRTVAAGLEGDLAFLTALGANCIVHDALGTSSDTLAGCTAGSAALGLVFEAALCVELLLTGGEDELLAAILAN